MLYKDFIQSEEYKLCSSDLTRHFSKLPVIAETLSVEPHYGWGNKEIISIDLDKNPDEPMKLKDFMSIFNREFEEIVYAFNVNIDVLKGPNRFGVVRLFKESDNMPEFLDKWKEFEIQKIIIMGNYICVSVNMELENLYV